MEIAQSEDQGAVVLAPQGEIDLHASPILRTKLRELLEKTAPAVVIDFSGVEYIDSSGLATLVEFVRDTRCGRSSLALFALRPKVKMVFELVRLNELFTITGTREEALAAVRAG